MNRRTEVTTVVERLLDNKDVHDHIANAARNLRDLQARTNRKGLRAAEDKKTYDKLREATTSLLVAGRIVKPSPPPRRLGRKLAVALGALAGGGLLVRKLRGSGSTSPQDG